MLVLGWYDHRLHRGIEKYAQEHGWRLSEDVARERVIPWGWEGDGILAWLGAGDDLADFAAQAKKPTVDFSYRRPQLKFARVLEDTTATANLVADHFLSRGFRNFLFYSDAPNWIYQERGTAFVRALELAGAQPGWLRWHESAAYRTDRQAWKIKRAWLAEALRTAPKPLGLFAASDGLALEALETCEAASVAVPESLAIVGAGNNLLAVDAMHTPISSVDVNLETTGYRGAALLDELMRHPSRTPPAAPVRVEPFRLIVRKSSDLMAVNHPGLAKGLRYLWDHCHEPIGVGDLAASASMSLLSFHAAFVEHLGRPPGAELHRLRIERAKRLLLETPEKLETIAEMSGFQSVNSLWVAFKRATGLSPAQFRKRTHRPTPE